MRAISLILGLSPLWCAEDRDITLLLEHKGPQYLRRAIAIKANGFAGRVDTLAHRFVAESRGLQYASLRIVTKADLGELVSPIPSHASSEFIEHIAQEMSRVSFGFAEVLRIGNSVILRSRDERNRLRSKIVAGGDPLALPANHGIGRVVWIQYWGKDESPPVQDSALENVAVFVVADKVSKEFAYESISAIKARLPHLDFGLWLSTRPWFPFVEWAPLLNPFEPSLSTAQRRETGLGIGCKVDLGAIDCKELSR